MDNLCRRTHTDTHTHFHWLWLAPPLCFSPTPSTTHLVFDVDSCGRYEFLFLHLLSKYTWKKWFNIQTSTQSSASQHFFAAGHSYCEFLLVLWAVLFKMWFHFEKQCSSNRIMTFKWESKPYILTHTTWLQILTHFPDLCDTMKYYKDVDWDLGSLNQ